MTNEMVKASILHKVDFGNHRQCRIQLPSGEKVLIRLTLAPGFYLGVFEIGSMNPFSIALDWLQSLATGVRTTGYIPIWGMGDESVSSREEWRLVTLAVFGLDGEDPPLDDREILDGVADRVMSSPSVDVLRRTLAHMQHELVNKSDTAQ